ncbi:hypothetical protein HLH26_09975 [Gluconacetobacter sp. 1b LMG 1731]|uniref:Wadjet protein JetD C-terminal domain-containing protein n=1 Tax=Gluconacetobacter dulcium TaxID=2729096 RepID=A0A7W4IL36_9PROT|nr:Wadjet anti-phage system protein JetD domain-containing protein [Gluconacetobacter dulcium]MBB2164860.1 hypothetical protein [Gluconacetobacter dulcium]MBB2194077.1 hypothetical protein [Gluconacetobacter dulcium]
MTWTTQADLRAHLERLWKRGILPNALITRTSLFPLAFPLRTPGAADITHRLPAVREWVDTLKSIPHVKLIAHTVNNRVQGAQTLPQTIVIETLEDALALLGKEDMARQIMALHDLTLQQAPFLQDWLSQNALTAYRHAAEWQRLLTLTLWMKENPAPNIYLRQVDLPGIHTKFIEQHKAVLSNLFRNTLPAQAVNASYSGTAQFESCYGFRTKPLRVRFRVLDAALSPVPASAHPDITLDAESFAALPLSGCRIFIVENENCFLAFPPLENALVIFGAGYCWGSLKRAHWLRDCSVYYWGDIDTHGFGVLDQLRDILPHTRSFLMDEQTFQTYRQFWDTEPTPVRRTLSRLTPSEQIIFTALQSHRFGPNLRLEQERIHFSDLQQVLDQLTGP